MNIHLLRGIFSGLIADLAGYVRGSIIRAGAAAWEVYDAKTAGHILVGDGTDIRSVAIDGDATLIGVLDTRYLRLNTTNDPLIAGLEVNAATLTEPALILQTTDDNPANPILEIQNAAGNMLSELESAGNLNFATATAANPGIIEINDTRFFHNYGTANLFIGLNAGNSTLTGTGLIGIGTEVLENLTNGSNNIAVGYRALRANTTGWGNIAIGISAMSLNTSGRQNFGLGTLALGANLGGYENVAIGASALAANTGGNANVAIGKQTLFSNVGGLRNMGIGTFALSVNVGGNDNIGIGSITLQQNLNHYNIGIGSQAGRYQQNGPGNVFIGYYAGRGTANHDKSHNVMIGYAAGQLALAADGNILIGYQAGNIITTGDYNIIIGYDVDPSGAAASNELNIGGIIFGDLSVPDVRLGDLTTNHLKVDNVGDAVFVGGAGLVFGSCYGNHIGWQQVGAVQNTWYNISIAAMNDGQLHNVTHDGNGMLTVTEPGMYLVTWSLCYLDDKANDHVEAGIEVSSSGSADPAGQGHSENKFASEGEHLSSSAILDLADNATIELCIRTTDGAPAPTIDVQAANISVVQIGGT